VIVLRAFLFWEYGMKIQLEEVQRILRSENIDGWLLYNFRNSNPFVTKILALPPELMCTRRYFYFIPASGSPQKLVHKIEEHTLDSLPGNSTVYISWDSLSTGLKTLLQKVHTVAMEYSPEGAIPYISVVDGGTLELVRKCGVTVVSSATLLQYFEARWTEKQLKFHDTAATHLRAIVDEAFSFIRNAIERGETITEYDVQQFILSEFKKRNLITDSDPNCSVNANSANPHYEPTRAVQSKIRKNDFVLIDLWAKCNAQESVYADITWTGYVGKEAPSEYENIFSIVKGSRDAALQFVRDNIRKGNNICGYEVDDVARAFITRHGYGENFIHRTGHSLGEEVHGNGANIDNIETHDERRIIPSTAFTIEPGIYLPGKFGVRSEINVYLTQNQDVLVTGLPMQEKVIPIMK